MNRIRPISVNGRKILNANDCRPELSWIPIEDIRVDEVYQREITKRGWSQVDWISNNFNWASFTPVLVSRIEIDLFALIDGQHRTTAALIAGYDHVPALVVDINQVEQAAAFTRVNSKTTQISPHNVFKAALAAGEKWAHECDRVVTLSGCRLMRSNKSSAARLPGEVFALAVIRDMVLNMEGEAVTAGLKALIESKTGKEVEVFGQAILKPWLKSIASNTAYLHMDLRQALDQTVDLFSIYNLATIESRKTRESRPPIMRRMICRDLDKFRTENCPRG